MTPATLPPCVISITLYLTAGDLPARAVACADYTSREDAVRFAREFIAATRAVNPSERVHARAYEYDYATIDRATGVLMPSAEAYVYAGHEAEWVAL
jgi:uncharacterized protein (DUF2236 family)